MVTSPTPVLADKCLFGSEFWGALDRGRRHRSCSLSVIVQKNWNSPLESGLEERERFYRALVEQTRDFITVVGRDGTILFKNRSNDHPSGYTAAELVGCNVFDFIHHDDLGRVRHAFEQTLTGVPASAVEHRFRYKDGSWRVFESVGHYASDFPSGPIAIINSRDITDRTSLEAQFRQVQRIEVIGRMATRVAHDFKSVLTSIVASADRLLERDLPTGVERSVRHLARTARQAQDWMNRVLSYTRHETDAPVPVNVNDVAIGLATLLHHLIGPECALTMNLSADYPWVTIEEVLLEQVIVNLVVNAREAMPGGGLVTITTTNTRSMLVADSAHVVLSVADTGTGMSPEVRSRIFAPFFGTKTGGGNSGLGLTTVAGIVGAGRRTRRCRQRRRRRLDVPRDASGTRGGGT
jgi:PAS domain S-box-containing protein